MISASTNFEEVLGFQFVSIVLYIKLSIKLAADKVTIKSGEYYIFVRGSSGPLFLFL